jgi:predicted nucleic acid-binding protein
MDTFVDSVVLIGAFYRNDQWHAQAAPIINEIDAGSGHVFITDFILAEVLNFLHQKAGHAAAIETLRALDAAENITLVRITDDQFSAGKACFEKYSRLSLVDALTVACMNDLDIHRIYSFDADFDGIPEITRLTQPSGS